MPIFVTAELLITVLTPSINPRFIKFVEFSIVSFDESSALARFSIWFAEIVILLATLCSVLFVKLPSVLNVRLFASKALFKIKLSFNAIFRSPFVLILPSDVKPVAFKLTVLLPWISPFSLFTIKLLPFKTSTVFTANNSPSLLSKWLFEVIETLFAL